MPIAAAEAKNKVSAYSESLPQWSKKILLKLRKIVLAADASIVEEWKWGPHYSSKGMICGVGAFQRHVKFTFFNGSAMKDLEGLLNHCGDNELSRSIKYTDGNEIDEKMVTAYIKESIAVNKKGFKREVKNKTVEIPKDLQNALYRNEKAVLFF